MRSSLKLAAWLTFAVLLKEGREYGAWETCWPLCTATLPSRPALLVEAVKPRIVTEPHRTLLAAAVVRVLRTASSVWLGCMVLALQTFLRARVWRGTAWRGVARTRRINCAEILQTR